MLIDLLEPSSCEGNRESRFVPVRRKNSIQTQILAVETWRRDRCTIPEQGTIPWLDCGPNPPGRRHRPAATHLLRYSTPLAARSGESVSATAPCALRGAADEGAAWRRSDSGHSRRALVTDRVASPPDDRETGYAHWGSIERPFGCFGAGRRNLVGDHSCQPNCAD